MKPFLVLLIFFQTMNVAFMNSILHKENARKNNKSIKIKDSSVKYLALGDSYTIGESVKENERFPIQLAERLNNEGYNVAPPKIIAKTGWTTDELKAGIDAANIANNFDLVTLLIGVNNQYRGRDTSEYRKQFAGLLRKAIDFAGGKSRNVIVLSIPDYGVTPFASGSNPDKIGKEIDVFNQIKRQETEKQNARYIYITGISRLAEFNVNLVAEDGLHPSSEMYRLWVDEIMEAAKEILEKT